MYSSAEYFLLLKCNCITLMLNYISCITQCLIFYTTAKTVKLKEDIVSHSPAELNFGLSHFINEIRRPNGESYAPDSIYYLCLGIQEVSHLKMGESEIDVNTELNKNKEKTK